MQNFKNTYFTMTELRTFNDFIEKLKVKADKVGIRDNYRFIEITQYINAVTEWLYLNWFFPSDDFKGYSKILPILSCLKKLKQDLQPLKITFNGLMHYLRHYNDVDIEVMPWTDVQIRFVCTVLITTFKENCHFDDS